MNEIREIHNPFKAWLDERGIPFHRNRPDKKTTAIKGDPDFLLTWCNYCVYIECKVPGRKLSKDQGKRIAYLRKAGNKVVIAYSLEDCIEAAKDIFRRAGWEKLTGEPPERSECPLDNERAAELIAEATVGIGDILSGRTMRKPKLECADTLCSQHSKTLWIGTLFGTDYVFRGDFTAGSTAEKLRRATPQDIRDLPRK